MITGEAWQDTDTLQPWALFDPDAHRIIPLGWKDWLTSIGSVYASHVFLPSTVFAFDDIGVVDGVIMVMVNVLPGAEVKMGKKYPLTCRITCANGEVQDKTLFLQMAQH